MVARDIGAERIAWPEQLLLRIRIANPPWPRSSGLAEGTGEREHPRCRSLARHDRLFHVPEIRAPNLHRDDIGERLQVIAMGSNAKYDRFAFHIGIETGDLFRGIGR